MNEKILLTDTMEQTANIFGNFDMNTAMVEKAFGVTITNRESQTTAGDAIVVRGEDGEGGALPDDFEVFVLSNRETYWGAAALFYPGVMDRVHYMLGDFYVIPSSVHELLLLKVTADADPNNIAEMIWSANRSVVDEEEVLSDDLYICDSDKLRIAVRGGSVQREEDLPLEP
jgi:hypothetical protein